MKKENDTNQPSPAIKDENAADSKPGMSRRRFVVATLAAASVLPLSKLALFSEAAAKTLPVRELLPIGPMLTQPEVVRSVGKTVQVNLNVVGKMVKFIDPASINLTDPDPKSVTYRKTSTRKSTCVSPRISSTSSTTRSSPTSLSI